VYQPPWFKSDPRGISYTLLSITTPVVPALEKPIYLEFSIEVPAEILNSRDATVLEVTANGYQFITVMCNGDSPTDASVRSDIAVM
jgi:hypothetical protein